MWLKYVFINKLKCLGYRTMTPRDLRHETASSGQGKKSTTYT